MSLILRASALLVMVASASLSAQVTPPAPPQETSPRDTGGIALPIATPAPACSNKEQWFSFYNEPNVRNVSAPNLLPVLPKGAATTPRTAVIVAPGGGFTGLRYSAEGLQVAERLAQRGIAAFVLKYRSRCTTAALPDFIKTVGKQAPTTMPGNVDAPAYAPALEDTRTAIRYVREHAKELGVDPSRIGFLGFSAGAIAALHTGERKSTADAPDFIGAVYPQMNIKLALPSSPAPLFVALAADDALFGRQGFSVVTDWQRANGLVELHFFQSGDHGFALAQRGNTSDHWFEEYLWWLEARKLIPPGR